MTKHSRDHAIVCLCLFGGLVFWNICLGNGIVAAIVLCAWGLEDICWEIEQWRKQ